MHCLLLVLTPTLLLSFDSLLSSSLTAILRTKARDAGDERHLRHLRAPPLLHLKAGAVVLLLRNLDGAGAVRPGAVRYLAITP